jgi:hypothetical protein
LAFSTEGKATLEALINESAQIEDPRCAWRVEHKLIDILVIAVCAVIGWAESFEDIALYGRRERSWLEQFLELPGGIPAQDREGDQPHRPASAKPGPQRRGSVDGSIGAQGAACEGSGSRCRRGTAGCRWPRAQKMSSRIG